MTRRGYGSTHHYQRSSIAARFNACDVLRLAGFPEPDRGGMMHCPIHGERLPSFHILERGYRCFGCGAHGGILDLVVVLGIAGDRAAAARWLEGNLGRE